MFNYILKDIASTWQGIATRWPKQSLKRPFHHSIKPAASVCWKYSKNSKFYKCSYLGALSPLTGYFPPPSPGSHLQVAVTLSESQVPSQVQLGFSGCSQMSPNHIIHNLRRGGSPRGKALSLNLFWVQIFPFYIFCVFFWTHCSECWILVPWLGIKPMPPAVEAQS